MKVNRWVDLLDRTGWTFIQAFLGFWIVTNFSMDWDLLKGALIAAAIAAVKATIGQHTGDSPIGDVVPGASVVEPPVVYPT